jgi:hypothetical protein
MKLRFAASRISVSLQLTREKSLVAKCSGSPMSSAHIQMAFFKMTQLDSVPLHLQQLADEVIE